ncbi:uncharacterized protein LOC108094581 [Drosophila ficusphila]|uniref:uncharacterized protein LOC108094581 n=1 Tax=Drosophila ficusphila TaxID=30025 RepID=UPI0007E7F44F|nr:uncharacterized protein LOC108094581 [Drosophila ficusphila]
MNNPPKKACKNMGDPMSSHITYVKKNGQKYRKFLVPNCCSRHYFQLILRLFNGPDDPYFLPIVRIFAELLKRYKEVQQNEVWSDEDLKYIHEGMSFKKDKEEKTVKGALNKKTKKVKKNKKKIFEAKQTAFKESYKKFVPENNENPEDPSDGEEPYEPYEPY